MTASRNPERRRDPWRVIVRHANPIDDGRTPEQQLACAVLAQAVRDAHPRRPVELRSEAAAWLLDLEAIRYWCDLAGLDPRLIIDRVETLLST